MKQQSNTSINYWSRVSQNFISNIGGLFPQTLNLSPQLITLPRCFFLYDKIVADADTALWLFRSERLSGESGLCLVKVKPHPTSNGRYQNASRVVIYAFFLFCFQPRAGPLRSKLSFSHKLETKRDKQTQPAWHLYVDLLHIILAF